MTERFNHAKVPHWSKLTESERYWAGYLARQVDDRGIVREWRYGEVIAFNERPESVMTEQARMLAYCAESLLVALTSGRTRIMFRALLQAAGYIERMTGPTSTMRDAFAVAQHRAEGILFEHTPSELFRDRPEERPSVPECLI